jgi:hypothetical protein
MYAPPSERRRLGLITKTQIFTWLAGAVGVVAFMIYNPKYRVHTAVVVGGGGGLYYLYQKK